MNDNALRASWPGSGKNLQNSGHQTVIRRLLPPSFRYPSGNINLNYIKLFLHTERTSQECGDLRQGNYLCRLNIGYFKKTSRLLYPLPQGKNCNLFLLLLGVKTGEEFLTYQPLSGCPNPVRFASGGRHNADNTTRCLSLYHVMVEMTSNLLSPQLLQKPGLLLEQIHGTLGTPVVIFVQYHKDVLHRQLQPGTDLKARLKNRF